jgi:hypothetical protein
VDTLLAKSDKIVPIAIFSLTTNLIYEIITYTQKPTQLVEGTAMAANSPKHFKAVEDGELYLNRKFLTPSRLTALAKRAATARAKAADIIERFKQTFCEPDYRAGGWLCLDVMSELTVPQMAKMLKRKKK